MIDPSSSGSGVRRGWTTEARTSMRWKKYTLEYYPKFNPTRNKFRIGILCTLRFKTVWEIIQYCLASKGYKAFGRTDLRILYDANILRGGEFMRNLLY